MNKEIFSQEFFIHSICYKCSSHILFNIFLNKKLYNAYTKPYPWIEENSKYIAYGTIDHTKKIVSIDSIVPIFSEIENSLFIKFLKYIKIPFLTEKKIDLLAKYFKNDLYPIFFNNDFKKLNSVLNIPESKIKLIQEKWNEVNVYILLHIKLLSLGLSQKFIKKLYKKYKEKSIDIIQENPYQVIHEIGFGFKTADQIAIELGIDKKSPKRICGAINYILKENELLNNTYIEKEELIKKIILLLKIKIPENIITDEIENLYKKKIIHIYKEIYISFFKTFSYEFYIHNFFKKTNQSTHHTKNNCTFSKNLSTEQNQAISLALSTHYTIITGSAGTGKSKVITEIYNYEKSKNQETIVLTQTGRASQRINELNKEIRTSTIHKILPWKSIKTNYNSQSIPKLQYNHIIIDESSMIDSELFYTLLSAISPETKITLVGDEKQLPPIGLGEVFNDLIECNTIPSIKLTKIFRQKNQDILLFAQSTALGIPTKLASSLEKNCSFLSTVKADLEKNIEKYIKKYFNKEKNYLNVQFITFLNKGISGTKNINKVIQNYIAKSIKRDKCIWNKFYLYDKIIIKKNNYNKNIRNGEIGIISDIQEKTIEVSFSHDKKILFNYEESEHIDLGYAINIYKSQGSESDNIILLLFMESFILLNKKALYTAITRAKEKIIIMGEKKALFIGIKSKNAERKKTILKIL